MMPDHIPSDLEEDDYFPWDCDGGDDDLGNYDESDDDGDDD